MCLAGEEGLAGESDHTGETPRSKARQLGHRKKGLVSPAPQMKLRLGSKGPCLLNFPLIPDCGSQSVLCDLRLMAAWPQGWA